MTDSNPARAILGALITEVPHYNDEFGDCYGGCRHSWSDTMSRRRYPHRSHDEIGGCMLIEFPDGLEEWHDGMCLWVQALNIYTGGSALPNPAQ